MFTYTTLFRSSEEEYFVSRTTAGKINRARENGGRIAVGTTVLRALESAASENGSVTEAHGYTRLKIGHQHRLRSGNALLTALHETAASHPDLLSRFVRPAQ